MISGASSSRCSAVRRLLAARGARAAGGCRWSDSSAAVRLTRSPTSCARFAKA